MADLLYTAVLERFTDEQFDEDFEFSGFIPESTTVFSAVVSAINSTGANVTDDRVVTHSISGTVVTVTLRAGSTEGPYLIKVVATSTSNVPSVQTKLLNVTAPGLYR